MTTDQLALTALLLGAVGLAGLAVGCWRLGTLLAEHVGRLTDSVDDLALEVRRAAPRRRTDTADLPEPDTMQEGTPRAATEQQPRPTGHRATRSGARR